MSVMAEEKVGAAVAKKAAAKKAAPARKAPAAKKTAAAPAGKAAPPSASTPAVKPLNTKTGEFAGSTHRLKIGNTGGTKVLMAQFLICIAVLGAGTIVPTPVGRPAEGVPHLVVKGTGLSLLFFILAMTAATGQRAARAASGLGGLITAGYLLTSSDARNILSWMSQFYARPGSKGAGVPTAATESPALLTYAPAVDYPWVSPDAASGRQAGPPAAGELTA